MPRTQPWTERLRALVEAGPISRDEAVTEMTRLIPPGRAFRSTEHVVDWVRERNGVKNHRIPADPKAAKEMQIIAGKKRIARQALWTQQKHNRVEEYEENGVRMLRKGPNAWPSSETSDGEG